MRQILQICNDFPGKQFIRVMGRESAHAPMLADACNMTFLPILDFQTLLNSTKGVL
jgi:hypothetical protein